MNMLTRSLAAGLVMATFSGCANMNAQQKNTAIGAAVGGVAGSVLTGGSAVGRLLYKSDAADETQCCDHRGRQTN